MSRFPTYICTCYTHKSPASLVFKFRNRVILSEILRQFYSFRHRCFFFYPFSDIFSQVYKRNLINFLLLHSFCVISFFLIWFYWSLTQTLFRTCVNAGGRLWITSRHPHHGYASNCLWGICFSQLWIWDS